ncbi:hypothetical protein ACFX4N_23880 [Priestia sp. YIM B13551]|uniref:hypothetical protein n=1 Tax=Priestia sp. YIM B13551 TaxID=3366306 RepID=UPI00366B5FA7
MKKDYTIELLVNGSHIEDSPITISSIDKNKFSDMLLVVEVAEHIVQESLSYEVDFTLRVFAGDSIIFDSYQSLLDYEKKHHIVIEENEHSFPFTESDFCLPMYVNGIYYNGKLKPEMIPNVENNHELC